MRTKTITLYSYDELSPEAQEKARDWYRNASAGDDFWSESPLEAIADAGALLGIDFDIPRGQKSGKAIWFSGFWSQGDGCSFDGTWRARDVQAGKIASEYPETPDYKPNSELNRIAGELAELAKRYPGAYARCDSSGRGHFQRVESEPGEEWPEETQYVADGADDFPDDTQRDAYYVARDEWRNAFPADDVAELLRDFTTWAYRLLESEYEYQNSDECIVENIRCNEYEFTEDGERA